jgi:NAD+ kinase
MRIGIHGRDPHHKSIRFTEKLLQYLKIQGIEIWVSSAFLKQIKSVNLKAFKIKSFDHGDNLKALDFFFSLGGDGTLLDSITYVEKYETPIVGINTGRLGFLATTSREETEQAIDNLIKGNYTIDSRSLLKLVNEKRLFEGLNFALNDFTIIKKDTSSMITVHVHVNGQLLNSYWADGVIVSTPTGSTGYSLSCGGPLVHPESKSFVITPVSPHTLTARPIIVSDDVELTFKVEGRSKKFLVSLDSRIETIDASVNLKLRRESFMVKLVQLPGKNYYNTLRQKLNWGLDVRN